jgi:hypothetical protein
VKKTPTISWRRIIQQKLNRVGAAEGGDLLIFVF